MEQKPRAKHAPRATHSLTQKVQLLTHLQTAYAESRQDDVTFAKAATEKLGFPVNARHVGVMRKEFNIPANKPRRLPAPGKVNQAAALAMLHNRVVDLEGTLDILQRRVRTLEDLVDDLQELIEPLLESAERSKAAP